MSWDHTQPMFHVVRGDKPSIPTTRRLAITLRTHIERARTAIASTQRADMERVVRRVPPPSFFAIGVLLGVMFAMVVVTAAPRANAAALRKLPTAATTLAPKLLFVDHAAERTRAPAAAPTPRVRTVIVAPRARAPKADAIFAAAL